MNGPFPRHPSRLPPVNNPICYYYDRISSSDLGEDDTERDSQKSVALVGETTRTSARVVNTALAPRITPVTRVAALRGRGESGVYREVRDEDSKGSFMDRQQIDCSASSSREDGGESPRHRHNDTSKGGAWWGPGGLLAVRGVKSLLLVQCLFMVR